MADEFKPNSYKSKQEQAETNELQAIDGEIKFKKNSSLRRLVDAVIKGNRQSVSKYLFGEILVPELQNAISSIVRNGVDMLVYGEARRYDRTRKDSRTPYRSFYDDDRRDSRHRNSYEEWDRSVLDFEDPIFETKNDADYVLNELHKIISRKGYVTVGVVYQLTKRSTRPTDDNFGWTNLRDAKVIQTRDGWWLKLPRPYSLD